MAIGALLIVGITFLLGVGLLVGGILLVVKAKSPSHAFPACGRCSYDLTASIGKVDRCPECGSAFAEVGILPPAGRRSAVKTVVGVVLLLAGLIPFLLIVSGLFMGLAASRAAGQRIAAQQAAAQAAQAAAATQPATAPTAPAAPSDAP